MLEPRLDAPCRRDARRGKPQDFIVGLIEEIPEGEKGLQMAQSRTDTAVSTFTKLSTDVRPYGGSGNPCLAAACRRPQPETAGDDRQRHTEHEKADACEQQVSPPARPMSVRPWGCSTRLIIHGNMLPHTHVSAVLMSLLIRSQA